MVMTVFNVQRMSKSSEVKGGGTATTVARTRSIDASPEVVPVEEGGGGAVPEGSTLGRLELSLSYEQPFAQEKWHLWKQLCVRAQKQGSHLTLKTIKSYE